ncbi:MAG: FAD-dependent monooxygenase [Bacteroidetes bacterium]|nr:FAD-dependent monooxygenase [Bacteroidota bacterium]MBS1972953.1 FAD-dependent monooxygenase [Bacteroidota bacterium]
MNNEIYDVAIVGGGLAGLALSIQLAKASYRVAVFEKEKYPFHKVCGEYISFENWNFLEELGLPLSDWNLPSIKRLMISAPNGDFLESELPLGGVGISRYKIDTALANIAKTNGVSLFEQNKITEITFEKPVFTVQSTLFSCQAKMVCGCYGKRSNLDVKLERDFILKKNNKLNNYIGVKYHIKTSFPENMIALHNFKNGYCGISQIEDNKFCLCYLTNARNLQLSNNSIPEMEKNILCKNPFLEEIFSSSEFLFEKPVVISQISFEKKTKTENHILMLGDAAGMITPLCGNGMSMAWHASKIAFKNINAFLKGSISRHEMEQEYADEWNKHFGKRLSAGRLIQRFFGNQFFSSFLIRTVKPFPKLITYLIRQTHGNPY